MVRSCSTWTWPLVTTVSSSKRSWDGRAASWLLLGGMLPLLVGCGTFLGTEVQPPVNAGRGTSLGLAGGYRGYLLNSEGLLLGGTAEVLPPLSKQCCFQVRSRGDIGFGVLPLPHTSALGIEGTIGPTIGNAVVRDSGANSGHFAVGGTTELSILWRVSREQREWEENALSSSLHFLVLSAGLDVLAPVGEVDHHGVPTLHVALTYRYMQWPTMVP
jgi:3',5'-cyclic AMP phosphodiesterase CpdA